jgi:hypothetical protein
VRVLVREIMRDWSERRINAEVAGEAIHAYLEDLHRAIRAWMPGDNVPVCCSSGTGDVGVMRSRFTTPKRPFMRRIVSRVASDSEPTIPRFESGVLRIEK